MTIYYLAAGTDTCICGGAIHQTGCPAPGCNGLACTWCSIGCHWNGTVDNDADRATAGLPPITPETT